MNCQKFEKSVKILDIRGTGSGQLVGRLSGGNQQKICVARALITRRSAVRVGSAWQGLYLPGKKLLNNAKLGEYFRVFACYAVIAVALALHAWKTVMAKRVDDWEG